MARTRNHFVTRTDKKNDLRMVVEGVGEFPLQQITLDFAKNSSPQAFVVPKIGREGPRYDKNAAAHELTSSLRRGQPVKVYAKIRGEWDAEGRTWPADERLVWDGRYRDYSLQKTRDRTTVGYYLEHWLSDLSSSSMLSADLHFASAAGLTDPAFLTTMKGTGAGEGVVWLSDLFGSHALWEAVQDDVAKGIKSLLCDIAARDSLLLAPADFGGVAGPARRNDRAMAALRRIEGPTVAAEGAGDCSSKFKKNWGVPAKLDHLPIIELADAIARVIAREPITKLGQASFWDAIVRWYCPRLSLALIPMVDRAVLVPDCPTIGKFYSKKLTPNDVERYAPTPSRPAMLRGVGIYGLFSSNTNVGLAEAAGAAMPDIPRVVGQYSSVEDSLAWGPVSYLEAPSWLSEITRVGPYASGTAPVDGVMPTSTTPTDAGPAAPPPSELLTSYGALFDGFAKMIFAETILGASTARIESKLRFDICPGTMLQIEPSPEKFRLSVDDLATPVFGQVVRVTVSLNTDPTACGTVIEMSHVRTKAEVESGDTTLAKHPLYGDNVFLGAPLVTEPDDAWAFLDAEPEPAPE